MEEEKNMLGEIRKQDIIGRWNYPDEYSITVRECGKEFVQFNADGTALIIQYVNAETPCERYEYPHTWSLGTNRIVMKMNGQTTNTFRIVKFDGKSMRVQPNGGNVYSEVVFTRDESV